MKLIWYKLFLAIGAAWIFGGFLYISKQYWCCLSKPARPTVRSLENQLNWKFFDSTHSNFIASGLADCQQSKVTHETAKKSADTVCSSSSKFPTTLRQLTPKQRQILLSHLIVNDEYKVIYCYTPKVACSNWKKVMKQLYGNLKQEDWVHMDHHHGFAYLSDYSDKEIKEKIRNYFKFMFIRNPTERALSVYRNKFNEIESFYKVYGKKIMSMYHKESPIYKGKVPGDDVPFSDFIRYLGTGVSPENMNEHYMPLTTLCQPCLIDYNYIGVYDNLAEDAEAIDYYFTFDGHQLSHTSIEFGVFIPSVIAKFVYYTYQAQKKEMPPKPLKHAKYLESCLQCLVPCNQL